MQHSFKRKEETNCAIFSTNPICYMYDAQGPKLHWMVTEEDDGSAVYADELIPSAT